MVLPRRVWCLAVQTHIRIYYIVSIEITRYLYMYYETKYTI